ncbi:Mov34/MPN/PAD-1 family protein [Sphingomonas pruni]|uniref:Mov34/MPN/PAD-1 family protein n=1 Tax=Sphingomonas pruni TaxID=40683 RepID=UPI000ABB07FB|nr:Mov34/MPN/PAD-1 family protein [Sphingomonas pruni]
MRLEISREVLAGIRAAAAAAHPEEACGLLFGGNGLINGWMEARNIAGRPETEFEIDPAALFAALRAERAGGAQLIGYWHSHPNGNVEPSRRDTELADADGKVWVIVAGEDIAAWQLVETPLYGCSEYRIEQRDGYRAAVPSFCGMARRFRHVPMATGEVRHLIPKDKGDDIVPLIAEAGYPAIAPILNDLMVWTVDPNTPICRALIDYLNTLGEPMVEPIRKVLRGNDGDHKSLCLREMVPALPRAARIRLMDDLRALAEHPSEAEHYEGVDDEARSVLAGLAESGA